MRANNRKKKSESPHFPRNDFMMFCLDHVCATYCRERENYCPIADEVRERYGAITGSACEMVWFRREEKK
jgi:hypothetical protein